MLKRLDNTMKNFVRKLETLKLNKTKSITKIIKVEQIQAVISRVTTK